MKNSESLFRTDDISSILLGIFLFIVYTLTLYPSVGGGDSGELITVAHTLGIAHPPGYPLYTMLAKIFSWLPFGSIAWRVNLFSSVSDALSAVFISLAVSRGTESRPAGLLAGGLFGMSPLIWTYATTAEVFPLNNLFIALLFFLAITYEKSKSLNVAYGTHFVAGLALTNHHTIALYALPILLWMAWTQRSAFRNFQIPIQLFAFFTLGLMPYAYLPWAASREPILSWGPVDTWRGFFAHVLRTDYGTLALVKGPGFLPTAGDSFRSRLVGYFTHIPGQLTYLGIGLALWGLYRQWKNPRHRNHAVASFTLFAFYLVTFSFLGNMTLSDPLSLSIYSRFWQQADIFLFLWIGVGFADLIRTQAKFAAIAPIAVLGLLALQMGRSYQDRDQHENRVLEHYGMALLAPLPPKALYVAYGDLKVNVTRYLHYCEGVRPDVTIAEGGLMSAEWFPNLMKRRQRELEFRSQLTGFPISFKELLDRNLPLTSIFVSQFIEGENDTTTWIHDYFAAPYGLSLHILPIAEKIRLRDYLTEGSQILKETEKIWSAADFRLRTKAPWELVALEQESTIRLQLAGALVQYSIGNGKDPTALKSAISSLEPLINRPNVAPVTYKILAVSYSELSVTEPSARHQAVAYWNRYLPFASPQDPDLPRIRAFLSGEASPNRIPAAGTK